MTWQMPRPLTELPDEHSVCEPPDPIPNSEVKPVSADGSVGFPHVRVGHRQASIFCWIDVLPIKK